MATNPTRELTVTLAGGYWLHTIRRLIRDLQPMLDLTEPTIVRLDLRRLTFMGPAALATTAAAMRRGRENGTIADASAITRPDSVGMRTYLFRMDFLRVLFEREPTDVPDPVHRHDAPGMKECEHFATEKGGRKVARDLAETLKAKVATDRSAVDRRLCTSPRVRVLGFRHAGSCTGFL